MSRPLVILLAFACGAAVANLYYAQPLLHAIATGIHTSSSDAALLVTATQIGYAAGLVLLVPLGDLLDRRRLVSRLLVVTVLGLAAAAAAPDLGVLSLALGVVGVTSVVAQILVPFASALASEDERGRVVGQVMSGLLMGILIARTVSGLGAAVLGWRAVFVIAAGLMLVLSAALWRALPDVAPEGGPPYPKLLASVAVLIGEEPVLRRRMVYGALGFATFSVLWTSLALLLSRPPFSYGEAVIGLFGLAGLAGTVAAQGAGRVADRGRPGRATGFSLAAIAIGWGLCALGGTQVVLIIAGIVVIDLGVQGQHILNQTIIYALRPEARSRLTTAYMTGNFLCGALASAAADLAWRSGGWLAVCALGGGLSLPAMLAWLDELRRGAGMPVSGRADESAKARSGSDSRLAEPARSR
ncbi:MAG: MFS transporter [Actinomycetota bacterium]|nr:MFS transporter [Actinomycetota bacterium]